MTERSPLLRQRGRSESGRVGMIELFFDLVFVFAVTQLSHTLLAHLDAEGAAHVALLLFAVWWVWIYTTWVTNWLDPERIPVRVCLFVLMFAGLYLSVAIPQAFGARGLEFAAAYVFMQVGRTCFFLWAVRGAPRPMTRNFQRILVWMLASGALWLAGGFARGDARFGLWMVALATEWIAPWAYFWVPGLGRSSTTDWDIEGSHLAERCALFVIIALGESLLVTGATFAELPWSNDVVTAFVIAVLGSVLMWWIYFDTGAERATERISKSEDPGRQARSAYTYLHLPIVAGIIVCAVGDEVLLTHPHHATSAATLVLPGGPLCYLAGTALFKWVTNDRRTPPLSHLVGLALLALATATALRTPIAPLTLGACSTLVLGLVAIWESLAIRRPAKG